MSTSARHTGVREPAERGGDHMTHDTIPQWSGQVGRPTPAVSGFPSGVPGECERDMRRSLSVCITRAASKQAYFTVRFLVDRDRKLNAYRAYAYFRWVDDQLDQGLSDPYERRVFVERQQALVDAGYRSVLWSGLEPEERMLTDLIASDHSDHDERSGLRLYIRHMMAVMAFDAQRRGRLIAGRELDEYTRHLAIAVTEALHYFIGHDDTPTPSETRYLPAMAAHITHMLRDTFEDVAAGYFNAPRELLESARIAPDDVTSAPYHDWVRNRVRLARGYFEAGARYLDRVKSLRCRIAGYAYMARFLGILDAIERDEYQLRPVYPEFKRVGYGMRAGAWVCAHALRGW